MSEHAACGGELVFAYAAPGAGKIFGDVFPRRSGRDPAVGTARAFVVFPAAYFTYIYHGKPPCADRSAVLY